MRRRVATWGVIFALVCAWIIASSTANAEQKTRSGSVSRAPHQLQTKTTPPYASGYRPLYPDAYARAKQRADDAASGHAKPGGGPKPPPQTGPGWNGQYETDLTPPDPTGAMGPTEYIELINLRFGIYDRNGAQTATGTLGDLTAYNTSDLSDPQILWDPTTQRFYYTVLNVAGDFFAFGYSKTATPAGAGDFCQYGADFGYGADYLPDYPKMGDSSDFITIGANIFFWGFAYVGSDIDWIGKPPPGTSCPDTLPSGGFVNVTNVDGSAMSTPVPAVQTDPSSTGWVIGTADVSTSGASNFITARSITNDGSGTPVLGAAVSVAVDSFDIPPNAPEKGSKNLIDTLDGRLEHAVAAPDPNHGGAMAVWTAHAVAGGAGSEERWYEIDPASASLLQSGKATSSTAYVWNGAVAPDRSFNGTTGAFGANMVMGFNTSSSSTYPAIQMVTKRGAGAQSSFVLIKQAAGTDSDFSCNPCRWGDYSGASADPAADQSGSSGRVWLSGEWNVANSNGPGTDWRTWNWPATP
jgi:hypothetical protein